MNTKHILMSTMLAAAAIAPICAHAAVISSNSGLTLVETFDGFDGLVTKGPQALSGGIVVTSSVYSTIGAYAVDLADNGTWGAGNKFAGIGDLSFVPTTSEGFAGSMTFDLGAAYDGVGALFSIFKDGSSSGQILIEALGTGNSVLESHNFVVDFNDPLLSNAGLFFGFSRASADIVGFRVSGDGFVLDNLSTSPAPVPVPAALPLLIGGLGMLAARTRRRG